MAVATPCKYYNAKWGGVKMGRADGRICESEYNDGRKSDHLKRRKINESIYCHGAGADAANGLEFVEYLRAAGK
jgi:hypothetical protein